MDSVSAGDDCDALHEKTVDTYSFIDPVALFSHLDPDLINRLYNLSAGGKVFSQHDKATQTVISQIIFIDEREIKLYPVKIRYAWPSELDLMAEIAELRLSERWDGWDKEKFTNSSKFHISVYEKY